MEILRWYPVLPLGVPRLTTTDDEYHGMFIPKGTVLYPNVWYGYYNRVLLSSHTLSRAMARSRKDYGPDHDAFRPERFFESGARDPSTYAFGFGRR